MDINNSDLHAGLRQHRRYRNFQRSSCILQTPHHEYYHDNPPTSTWVFWSTPLLDLLAQMPPRNVTTRAPPIISRPHDVRSAWTLCGSAASKGPDLVSLGGGIDCDMATKIQWRLCSASIVTNCYSWKTHSPVTFRRLLARDQWHVIEWKHCWQPVITCNLMRVE